jgi:hypothetical protein
MIKNKKQNREQKKEKKNHTWKENEVCLLFPNFKPASNQTKIQKFLKIIFIIKHIKKTRIFLKKKKEKRKINKCIKKEKNEDRQNKNRKN